VWYDADHRVGQRVTRTRLATGKEISEGSTYTLAVPDFLAAGGSGYAMLVGAPAQDLSILDLDLLINYIGVLRTPAEAPVDVRFHRAGR
jgi:2',3'-cyclic-nucleotide 2'-phosphodiesterase (5'-nucleotidase family)